MPNLAPFHPQIVHFVVALTFVGVALRLASFTPWFAFANVAARTLIVVAAIAGAAATRSGLDAHGPVERIPGARAAVAAHEEAGEKAHNVLLVVAAFELLAWALTGKRKLQRAALAGATVAGLASLWFVFDAARHGGDLVYSYAGGVGIRSGNPEDIDRLLVAGLYNAAQADRRAGRKLDAARLVEELARLRPADPDARLLLAGSRLHDRDDARGALATVDSLALPSASPRLRFQAASLRADAYLALGRRDSARAVLEALAATLPNATRLKARIDSLR